MICSCSFNEMSAHFVVFREPDDGAVLSHSAAQYEGDTATQAQCMAGRNKMTSYCLQSPFQKKVLPSHYTYEYVKVLLSEENRRFTEASLFQWL